MIKHIDSEEVILSSLLSDYHHSLSKIDGLTVNTFSTKTNRLIFASMVTMAEDKVPIDPISVSKDSGVSISEISDIMDKHVSFEHLPYHCALVVNAWKLNEMVSVLQREASNADPQTDPSELAEIVTMKLQSIDTTTSGVENTMADIFDKMMTGVLDRFDKKIP